MSTRESTGQRIAAAAGGPDWIEAEWGASPNNRPARFYKLTKAGWKQLAQETSQWRKLVAAIGRVLGPEV